MLFDVKLIWLKKNVQMPYRFVYGRKDSFLPRKNLPAAAINDKPGRCQTPILTYIGIYGVKKFKL
ncbi:hypothetical protein C7N43_05710 [Sphingobacteriales bacterium UPWRP_1]|nr:hypothetical protein C7N43_05710 [Sphingobacteriales bacterium UPWRP_1]